MRWQGPSRAIVASVALSATLGGAARLHAHVVYGTPTIHQLVLEADVVARARVTDADAVVAIDDPPLRRPVVTVELLESLKGDTPCGLLTFAPHGHGTASYAEGEEVLLFLRRIERTPELARTPLAKKVTWVSRQESTHKIPLTAQSREAYLAAVRAYVAVDGLPASPAIHLAALRRITVKLLASREPGLAASAVRDLVFAGDAPLVTADDVPALEAVLADSMVAIGTRVALLAELERRALVDGPPRWVELLRSGPSRDRLVTVRAVAAHPSAPVTRELLALLQAAEDPATRDDAARELTAAAAVSLGVAGNDGAVEALARALGRDDARLRMAAIRGLGRIGTAAARRVLETAAAFHPDPATRRRAGAEVTVLGRSESLAASTLAPSSGTL